MLAKIKAIVKRHRDKIYLGLIIFSVALLSFSLGWILAKKEAKTPLEFNYSDNLAD